MHLLLITRSSGCRVVKLLACGARGPGFESRPRHLNFQRLVISKSRYGWKIAKSTLILKTLQKISPISIVLCTCNNISNKISTKTYTNRMSVSQEPLFMYQSWWMHVYNYGPWSKHLTDQEHAEYNNLLKRQSWQRMYNILPNLVPCRQDKMLSSILDPFLSLAMLSRLNSYVDNRCRLQTISTMSSALARGSVCLNMFLNLENIVDTLEYTFSQNNNKSSDIK